MRLPLVLVLGVALAGLVSGCSGPPNVKVKGTLTNGNAMVPVGNGGMTVVFIPVIEEGQEYTTYPAVYNKEDGSFEVAGPDGRGIPAGKYRVAITAMAVPPSAAIDRLNNRFTQKDSPIILDVSGNEPLAIDLSKY